MCHTCRMIDLYYKTHSRNLFQFCDLCLCPVSMHVSGAIYFTFKQKNGKIDMEPQVCDLSCCQLLRFLWVLSEKYRN